MLATIRLGQCFCRAEKEIRQAFDDNPYLADNALDRISREKDWESGRGNRGSSPPGCVMRQVLRAEACIKQYTGFGAHFTPQDSRGPIAPQ
jgi:hypothetical protein